MNQSIWGAIENIKSCPGFTAIFQQPFGLFFQVSPLKIDIPSHLMSILDPAASQEILGPPGPFNG